MGFWTRIKQAWAPKRKVDFSPIKTSVNAYFEAGHRDVLDLCDALCLTPGELYRMLDKDESRINILPYLPEKERKELEKELCERIFSRNDVYWAMNKNFKPVKFTIDEVIASVSLWQANAMIMEEARTLPPVKSETYLSPRGDLVMQLTLVGEGCTLDFGTVTGLTTLQHKLLKERYGELNPGQHR